MTKQPRLRSLLWFDCTAASVVGVTMLAVSGLIAPLFGMPRAVLVATALANLAYGGFSYSLARLPEAPCRRVRALVVANFAWTVVCVGLAATFARPGSWLGVAYVLAEGVFVGGLAAMEARARGSRRAPPQRWAKAEIPPEIRGE
jgi:hypothetical protein